MATTKKITALIMAFVMAFLPNVALARGCGCFFNHHVVPVVAVPTATIIPVYQVGSALEMRAEAVKAMRDYGIITPNTKPVGDDQHIQNARKQPSDYGGQTPQKQTGSHQVTGNLSQMAPTLWAKCWSCHADVNKSGGAHWDFSKGITGDEFLRITDMVANKTNVPDKMKAVINGLKPDEYGKILDEAIKVAKATKLSTVAVPPSQETSEAEAYRF